MGMMFFNGEDWEHVGTNTKRGCYSSFSINMQTGDVTGNIFLLEGLFSLKRIFRENFEKQVSKMFLSRPLFLAKMMLTKTSLPLCQRLINSKKIFLRINLQPQTFAK